MDRRAGPVRGMYDDIWLRLVGHHRIAYRDVRVDRRLTV
jgi:hypothetical protein